MNKTCNLSTVNNTPSEARRNASAVVYYYIDFCDNSDTVSVLTANSVSQLISVIYDYLDKRDIYYIDVMYICAIMSDGSVKRIKKLQIDSDVRELIISNAR